MTTTAKTTAKKYFIVIDGELRLKVHKGPSGMYVAESLDVAGLATQGGTIEEVIANAHDAAKVLAESRALMAKELAKTARSTKPGATTKKNAPRKTASRNKSLSGTAAK